MTGQSPCMLRSRWRRSVTGLDIQGSFHHGWRASGSSPGPRPHLWCPAAAGAGRRGDRPLLVNVWWSADLRRARSAAHGRICGALGVLQALADGSSCSGRKTYPARPMAAVPSANPGADRDHLLAGDCLGRTCYQRCGHRRVLLDRPSAGIAPDRLLSGGYASHKVLLSLVGLGGRRPS